MTTQPKTVSTSSLMQEGRTFPPSKEVVQRAHINAAQYKTMYERSIKDPDGSGSNRPTPSNGSRSRRRAANTSGHRRERVEHTWFEDGQLNVTVNCLDRHLKTKTRDKVAILWQGEPENDVVKLTYAQLHQQVCKFANVLKSFGIKKGDRVSIYLPMIPELPVPCSPARASARFTRSCSVGSAPRRSRPHQRRRLQTAHHLQHLAPRRQKHSVKDHGRRGAQGNLQHREGHCRQAQRNPVRHDAEPRRLVPRRDGHGFRGLSAATMNAETRCSSFTRPARRVNRRASSIAPPAISCKPPSRTNTSSTCMTTTSSGAPPTSAG